MAGTFRLINTDGREVNDPLPVLRAVFEGSKPPDRYQIEHRYRHNEPGLGMRSCETDID